MPILVNNELVDDQLIRDEARRLKIILQRDSPAADMLALELQAREWARDTIIVRTLLRQVAGSESPEALLERLRAQVPKPRTKEISAHFHQFRQLFQRPELVRVSHIVKHVDEATTSEQAEKAIRRIEAELLKGADFAATADNHSDCPGNGGDLGLFPMGRMVAGFDEAISRLQPGEMSPVFRTVSGSTSPS